MMAGTLLAVLLQALQLGGRLGAGGDELQDTVGVGKRHAGGRRGEHFDGMLGQLVQDVGDVVVVGERVGEALQHVEQHIIARHG